MLFNALSEIYTQHEILIDEAMSNHTSFKIGGKAKVIVTPRKIEQIKQMHHIHLKKTKIKDNVC